MSRCKADNKVLSSSDMGRKDAYGNYYWLCSKCWSKLPKNYISKSEDKVIDTDDYNDDDLSREWLSKNGTSSDDLL